MKIEKTYKICNLKKSDNNKVSCISLTWLYTCLSYGVREQSPKPNLKACSNSGNCVIVSIFCNPIPCYAKFVIGMFNLLEAGIANTISNC